MISFTKVRSYFAFIAKVGVLRGSTAVIRLILSKIQPSLSKIQPSFFKQSEFLIELKGLTKPIHMRPSTSDWTVFNKVFIDEEYQEPTAAHSEAIKSYYLNALGQGRNPVIIDCGANIGLSSLWYATIFPEASIVAIEPECDNFALLTKNLSSYEHVVALRGGVSALPTKLALANPSGEPWAWETREDDHGTIEGITIDSALNSVDNPIPLIVKIDIEGFERQLFGSNVHWISKVPLIVMETHDWLFPWKGCGHTAFSSITSEGSRDYTFKGENVFCYSHELLKDYHLVD